MTTNNDSRLLVQLSAG